MSRMTAYEEEVRKIGGEHRSMWGEERYELCRRYAWAIPCEEALHVIESVGPIVEGGAGSGYWAKLLRERGVDVVAYDEAPYANHWVDAQHSEVCVGGPGEVGRHGDRTLLLVWPPYNKPMGVDHLRAADWQTVVVVGEPQGGCTGDYAFHAYLEAHYEVVQEVTIPQWYGINDYLAVYRRTA